MALFDTVNFPEFCAEARRHSCGNNLPQRIDSLYDKPYIAVRLPSTTAWTRFIQVDRWQRQLQKQTVNADR